MQKVHSSIEAYSSIKEQSFMTNNIKLMADKKCFQGWHACKKFKHVV